MSSCHNGIHRLGVGVDVETRAEVLNRSACITAFTDHFASTIDKLFLKFKFRCCA